MAKQGKRFTAASKSVDPEVRYPLNDAVKLVKAGAKGQYLKKVAISSTMGPGVRVDVGTLGAQGAQ